MKGIRGVTISVASVVFTLLSTAIHSTSAAESSNVNNIQNKPTPTEQEQLRNLQSNSYCGCDACTNQILNKKAGQYKCKARIQFKESSEGGSLSREDACAFVANEYPNPCGPCECATVPVSTPVPTASPTENPTDSPTSQPTESPTSTPTKSPTESSTAPPTSSPTKTPTPPPVILPPLYCGCHDCTQQVWDTYAGAYQCGARITYKQSSEGGSLSHVDACAFVSNEFPSICGPACDPALCDQPCALYTEPFVPEPITITPDTPQSLSLSDALYCFPEYAQRERYEGAFGGDYVIETKDGNGEACGPGNNYFSGNTVLYDAATQELTIEYKKIGNTWTGGEVRILRTSSANYNGITFPYGTFSFSVKSISILDDQSNVISTKLPSDLVLGMFTWDIKEDYAQHENWNHEVDIEISQWGDPANADVQFLTQPWDEPGPHFTPRFFSGGADNTYDQGGHTYEFTWEPNEIIWQTDAAGGTTRVYSTTIARESCNMDYIQCLPSNTEVRINLWNMGSGGDGLRPDGLASDSHRVVVVIDDFTFVESVQTHVVDGAACSKHCQCSDSSLCLSGVCVPDTA